MMLARREFVKERWLEPLAAAGLSSQADLLAYSPVELRLAGDWQLLSKPGLAGRQRWQGRLPEPATTLFVKRYVRGGWRLQLDRILRQNPWHSRAWWEFTISQRLAGAYVAAAEAIGCCEQMTGLLERRSAVLLRSVGGDGFDRAWTAAVDANRPITRGLARHDTTRRLARFISAFHQTGLCHRDLYLCHIFAELDPAGVQPPRFALIDLARVLRPRWRRMRWIIKDLAQLDSSARQIGARRTDRLRFLVAYLSLQPDSARVRWYVRRVTRKSDRILRRIARKSRGR